MRSAVEAGSLKTIQASADVTPVLSARMPATSPATSAGLCATNGTSMENPTVTKKSPSNSLDSCYKCRGLSSPVSLSLSLSRPFCSGTQSLVTRPPVKRARCSSSQERERERERERETLGVCGWGEGPRSGAMSASTW